MEHATEELYRRHMMTKAIGIVGTVVVTGLFITGVRSLFTGTPETPSPTNAVSSNDTSASPDIPNQVAASIESERQAVAKAALSIARDEAQAVLSTLDKASAAAAAWENEVAPLLTNERGKMLAANADYVRSFDTINQQRRPTPEEIASARVRVSSMLQQVTDALDGNAALYKPSDERRQILAAERTKADAFLQSFTEARQTVAAMLVHAEQLGHTAPHTLQDAIDEMNREYAAQQALVISQQRERAEQEHRERLADLEYEKQTAIHEADRAKRAAELDRERTRLETQTQLTKEQEKAERLRQLAEDPDIQRHFAPFLADGTFMVNEGGYTPDGLSEPGPLSYKGLTDRGVFKDYKVFAQVASYSTNDRPTWPPPETKEEWAKCREDWKRFRELAPVWLEMGKLNP